MDSSPSLGAHIPDRELLSFCSLCNPRVDKVRLRRGGKESSGRWRAGRELGRCDPADLSCPELFGDASHAGLQMAAECTERKSEELGGRLLGGGRLHVAAVESAVQLVVARR